MAKMNCCLPGPGDRVGYCKYHDWQLGWPEILAKKCLRKENTGTWCKHFRPNLSHPHWSEKNIPAGILVKIQAAVERKAVAELQEG